jgi:hypothetical protein
MLFLFVVLFPAALGQITSLSTSFSPSPSPTPFPRVNMCSSPGRSGGWSLSLPSARGFLDIITNAGAGTGTGKYERGLNNPPCTLSLDNPAGVALRLDFFSFETESGFDKFRVRSTTGVSFDSGLLSGPLSRFSQTVPAGATTLEFTFVSDSLSLEFNGVFVRAGALSASPSAAPYAAPASGGASITISGGAIAGIVFGVLVAAVLIPVVICIACCGGVAGAWAACAARSRPTDKSFEQHAVTISVQNPVGACPSPPPFPSPFPPAPHHPLIPTTLAGIPLQQPMYAEQPMYADYGRPQSTSFAYPPPAYPPPQAPSFALPPHHPPQRPASAYPPTYPPPPSPFYPPQPGQFYPPPPGRSV